MTSRIAFDLLPASLLKLFLCYFACTHSSHTSFGMSISGTFCVQPPSADSAIKHAACDILCNGLTATSAHEKTCSVQACVFKPFLILLENKVSSSVKLGRNLFYYVSVRSPFLICIALGRWFCFVVGFFFFS